MISEQDRVRARSHMGYLGVGSVSTFSLGIPAGMQTQFMIEGAWDKVLPQHETQFRLLLDRLDRVEEQIDCSIENLAASSLGEITLRGDEFERLLDRYRYWQGKLGNLLGVTPNPFDMRWRGGGGMNVSVNH